MFSNSNRLLAWVKKPSQYNLKKMMTLQQRKQSLGKQLALKPKLQISRLNVQYRDSYDLIKKEKENQLMKYQNSILWSPRFTPWHFKFWFLYPAMFVTCLILYIHYIAQPRKMLKYKQKYGIKFPTLQPRGWLIGWLDEYRKPDSVLQFQTYTLKDMEKSNFIKFRLLKQAKYLKRMVCQQTILYFLSFLLLIFLYLLIFQSSHHSNLFLFYSCLNYKSMVESKIIQEIACYTNKVYQLVVATKQTRSNNKKLVSVNLNLFVEINNLSQKISRLPDFIVFKFAFNQKFLRVFITKNNSKKRQRGMISGQMTRV